MRLRCHYWPKRIVVYSLCFFLLMFSYPRPSYAVLPLLLAAVPVGTATFAEVAGISMAYTAANGGPMVGVLYLSTMTHMNNEFDRALEQMGNNLRAERRIPVVGAAAIAKGIIEPSAFNVDMYGGKVVNVTSPSELAALSPQISGVDALYGTPSRINPVPVFIPELSPDYYPKVPTDAVLSSYPNGVYNVSAKNFDNSFNPDKYGYATARTVEDLLDLYIAGNADSFKYIYNNRVNSYQRFIDDCEICSKGGIYESNYYLSVYTVIRLDEFSFPDLIKVVSHSDAKQRYNINGAMVSLPVMSHMSASIPNIIFNNTYQLDNYVRESVNSDFVLQSSKIENRTYNSSGYSLGFIDIFPNSNLAEKPNTEGQGAIILSPLYTQPDIITQLQNVPLTAAQVASLINTAWQNASVRPDYTGIPYSSAVSVSTATVTEVLQARNISLSMANLLEPVSQTGRWDLPVYNITLNQYVSNTYVEQVPELDLGPNPNTQAPALKPPLSMSVILAPITNILPFMRDIDLHSRAAQCPIFELDIEYFKKRYILDSHCALLNNNSPLISSFFIICWTMLSLFIVIRRRG